MLLNVYITGLLRGICSGFRPWLSGPKHRLTDLTFPWFLHSIVAVLPALTFAVHGNIAMLCKTKPGRPWMERLSIDHEADVMAVAVEDNAHSHLHRAQHFESVLASLLVDLAAGCPAVAMHPQRCHQNGMSHF